MKISDKSRIESFERLFKALYRRLCIYSLHYVGDVQAAEDVVQECFLAYWRNISSSDDIIEANPERGTSDKPADRSIKSPEAYLFHSVRNRCIDFIRSKGKTDMESIPADCDSVISDDEAIERSGMETALWNAIDRLPEKRRKILLMSKMDGMSYEAVASRLGISVFTVRNQISRALASLRSDTGLSTGMLLMLLV